MLTVIVITFLQVNARCPVWYFLRIFRRNKMTDLIGTIASDEEIDYNDDSEDEFVEKIHTKKDREASG